MSRNDSFDLLVHVPALDWQNIKRRVRYLESVIVQICREKVHVKEWFSVSELAELKLMGLPHSKAGISRQASRNNWTRRPEKGRGGKKYLYHFYSLPAPAFDDLIKRIIETQSQENLKLPDQAPLLPPAPHLKIENTRQTAAPWVLPLMRVIRAGKVQTVGDIMRDLPNALPSGVDCPDVDEVRNALHQMGLI